MLLIIFYIYILRIALCTNLYIIMYSAPRVWSKVGTMRSGISWFCQRPPVVIATISINVSPIVRHASPFAFIPFFTFSIHTNKRINIILISSFARLVRGNYSIYFYFIFIFFILLFHFATRL